MIGFVLQFVPSLLLLFPAALLKVTPGPFRARPARQVRRDAQSRFSRYERPGSQVEYDLSPNTLSNQTEFAAAKSGGVNDVGGDDWSLSAQTTLLRARPLPPSPVATPKVRMVKASHEIETPSSVAPQRKTAKGAPPATPVKQKVAGTPTLITPVNATPAQVQASTPTASAAQGGPASPGSRRTQITSYPTSLIRLRA